MRHNAQQSTPTPTSALFWLGPLLFMCMVGTYFVGRYGGQWAENDSMAFAQFIRSVVQTGELAPPNGQAYPNGYGYQAISAFVIGLTGLEVADLQQLVYPVVAAMLVLPAWALYREFSGSARGATLATVLLFTQPEFLFVILRSSHEKFTRTLMLLCLLLLVRSFKLRQQPWLLGTHIVLFYLAAYAFIANNNLLAHSFIFAVACAMLLGWLLERYSASLGVWNGPVLRRLFYVTLVSISLVYLFTFYAYPPAQHDFLVIKDIWSSVAQLFLDVEEESINAYAQVQAGWVSLPIYFLVSIANWIVLGTSFVIWARQSVRWVWKRESPPSQAAWLLWLLYTAFAFQGALSVVVDASGTLGANLQHRLFPSFSIIAVALVGTWLSQWQPRRFRRIFPLALTAAAFCIAILSMAKATNEPLLSNKWTFYRASELAALRWTDAHLSNDVIGTEFDERLSAAFGTVQGQSANGNYFRSYAADAPIRSFLLSELTVLRSSRLGEPLPMPYDALLVYDNGDAALYHRRPLTPYQR